MNRIPSHLMTHYMRLGLRSVPATRAEISAAYRTAALKHHPDKGGSAPDFAAVTDSYHCLMRAIDPGFHPAHNGSYRPASLRSCVDNQRAGEPSPFSGILTAIVAPALIGILVGVRMIYFGGERTGLRAGGVSRFREGVDTTSSNGSVVQRDTIEKTKQYFQQQEVDSRQNELNQQRQQREHHPDK